MSEFNVGDEVVSLDPDFSFYGEVGIIRSFDSNVYSVYIPSKNSAYNHYEHELKLAEQEEEQVENTKEVKVTGKAFKYGYKVGDVVKWVEIGKVYTVSKNGHAYGEAGGNLAFCNEPKEYSLVKPAKETAVDNYKTTITTTISLGQGQVESLLIKALGLEGKGAKTEWNQDGSVEISYVNKE